jgi:DNA-binding PadR family transcriptional regulator
VLKRLEARGWLRCKFDPDGGRRARREYSLTARGRRALELVKGYLAELRDEVNS